MASLLAAGNQELVSAVYRKLIAVRLYLRAQRVGDVAQAEMERALSAGQTTPEEVEAIFRLTSLPTFEERFVIPPLAREVALGQTQDPFAHKPEAGFGFRRTAVRRW
jgi:nitrate reductase beta subunit